jgi:hypothetical protein
MYQKRLLPRLSRARRQSAHQCRLAKGKNGGKRKEEKVNAANEFEYFVDEIMRQ